MDVAVAVAAGVIVPQPGEHALPFCRRAQVTPLLFGSFLTSAVNCCVLLRGSSAPIGTRETVSAGTETVVEAEAGVKATAVAVIVTFISLEGGLDGAE